MPWQLGFLGENDRGFSTTLTDWRDRIDSGWTLALAVAFAVPAMCAAVSVASAVLQIGRPALTAGQVMLVLLPLVWFELVGLDLPLAIVVQDGCAQLEDFTYLVISEDERPQYQEILASVRSFTSDCAQEDALTLVYEPINTVTRQVTINVNNQLAGLNLRPATQASSDRLASAAAAILDSLATVGQVTDCSAVYALWLQVKSSICCDFGYAVTVALVGRLLAAIALIPAAIAAIAGYKRFRRHLWGPYATIQALEVGAYL